MQIRPLYWLPVAILVFSFFFHLSFISKGPVSVDCLNLVMNSQATLQDHQLHYQFGSGYPLMVLLGCIFISLGKWVGITDPVLSANFISVLFSSAAIFAFYLFVEEICDTLTAFIASIVLLINPIFLDISTYGINHSPALCFLLLGFLSLLRFQTTRNHINLLIGALCFGLTGATRLPDFMITLPSICFIFWVNLKNPSTNANKNDIPNFILFISTIFLIILLFHLPYYSNHSQYTLQATNNFRLNLTGSFHGIFLRLLLKNLTYLIKSFSIIGMICFTAGLYFTALFNKRLLVFTTLWWAIPLFFFSNIITSSPRYLSALLPAIIIPISIFLRQIFKNKNTLWKLIAPIACLIVFIQPLLNVQKTLVRRHRHAFISDFYLWVGQMTPSDSIVISSDDASFINYYSKRGTLEKPAANLKHFSPGELVQLKEKLDNILHTPKTVYITELALIQNDHFYEFKNLLEKNYQLIKVGEKPLELWYDTPFDTSICDWGFFKIEKKK